jgi:hypothetical protein
VGRLTAVSFRPYRRHQFELRDDPATGVSLVIHPPGGHGAPHRLDPGDQASTLADLIRQAKAMVDAVMGPKPIPTMRPGGYARPRM